MVSLRCNPGTYRDEVLLILSLVAVTPTPNNLNSAGKIKTTSSDYSLRFIRRPEGHD